MRKLLGKIWRNEVDANRLGRWCRQKTARLDPSDFDPDEFPVVCLECGYELRGEELGYCPECSTIYDRGRLLVRMYLRRETVRRSPTHRWGWRLFVVGLFIYLAPVIVTVLGQLMQSYLPEHAMRVTPSWFNFAATIKLIMRFFIISKITGYICFVAGVLLFSRTPVECFSKRRKKLNAWVREHRPWEQTE